jgi:hypothetical protein
LDFGPACGARTWAARRRLDAVNDFMTRLAANVRGGFIGASIWDSDGAFLVVGAPGLAVGRYWLQIDRVIGFFVVPWAPFDEDGNPLSPDEVAAQQAEWNIEADAYREKMLRLALSTEEAADLCVNWARQSNLTPRPATEVANVLTSMNVFVEETFGQLLGALGAHRGGRQLTR